jgi:hypothetical protein
MRETNLLASAALFSELYNSDKYTNLLDILAEFIKGAIVYDKKFSYLSIEFKDLLKSIYGFDIPESVIRTTLNNRFRDKVDRQSGYYNFDSSVIDGFESINEEYISIDKIQRAIIDELYEFISEKVGHTLVDSEKSIVFDNFNHFLLDNGYSNTYSNHISAFIITNEKNKDFRDNLNSIREGLILYQGIKFTDDLNESEKLPSELTFYLNTEHLFNALGYNGILYKEIFDDFYKLVREINNNARRKTGKSIIHLKYFNESNIEVDSFFYTAELIKRGKMQLIPSKSAMKKIIDECKDASDIKLMRVRFNAELSNLGIVLDDFNQDYSSIQNYNIEDQSVIDELKKISQEKDKSFDEKECTEYLNIYTKINYYRKGNSKKSFENIGHLLITENSFAKYLAHNNIVKFGDADTAFAKDIDFIITKLWFKQKKGFSTKQSLPKSFDVVNKAKIILSSHLVSSISSKYNQLVSEVKSGKLTPTIAAEMVYALREKPNKPEELTVLNIDNSFSFLNDDDFFENINRERVRKESELESTKKERDELQQLIYEKTKLEVEIENKTILAIYNADRRDYIESKWNELKRKNNRAAFYIIKIIILNFLLAAAGLLIALNQKLKEWFCEFGIIQILVILFYVSFFTIEIVGRSYLFDKEKTKLGWKWIKLKLSSSAFLKYITDEKDTFKTDYETRIPIKLKVHK